MKGIMRSRHSNAPGDATFAKHRVLYCDTLESAIGSITVCMDQDGRMAAVYYSGMPQSDGDCVFAADSKMCAIAKRELAEYFSGERRSFDIECAYSGGTDFEREVWAGLCRIPYGRTITYGELALRIGKPRAYRAVGNAAGANPIPIVVPCHRLVASDGKLGGYSSGLEKKRFLLALERESL